MVWLSWAIPLIAVIFLWTLNDFLRGRNKVIIGGVLVWIIFALCVVAFFVSGWRIGLAALVRSFILGNLFRRPAYLIARKLIEYPDLGVDDYSRKRFERTLNNFGSPESFEQHEKEKREETSHMARTIDKALSRSEIQEVLKRHSYSKQDVEAFYQRFEISSLPPQLREEAVCNARMLEYFLENSVVSVVSGEYTRNVLDQDVAITLTLWAKHRPGEKTPR